MAVDTGSPGRFATGHFLPFVLTSGIGWLVDLAILLVLTSVVGIAPFVANVASSLTAATLVYGVAHRSIYAVPVAAMGRPLALYVAYSVVMILAASGAVGQLVLLLADLPLPVLLAKVVVTPPLLLMNFAVSRALALGARHG